MANLGPGPAKYQLPATVGFHEHDATRERWPAFSMARQLAPVGENIGPGAAKYDTARIGAPHVAAYMARQYTQPDGTGESPGPGKYRLPTLIGSERVRSWKPTAADFSMAQRLRAPDGRGVAGPGPAGYQLPDTFGKHMRNIYKNRGPEYSMAGQLKPIAAQSTPGPAKYDVRSGGSRSAGQTMAGRLRDGYGGGTPGANKYNLAEYKPGKRRPQYSMGLRTQRNPMIVPADNCD